MAASRVRACLKLYLELGVGHPLAYELLVGQDAEVRSDILDALRRRRRGANRRQGAVRKDPAEDGSRLGHVFGVLRQTVDASAQHAGQRIRDANIRDLPYRAPVAFSWTM